MPDSPTEGRCPCCETRTGPWGQPCPGDVCSRKGYAFIPGRWYEVEKAHAERKGRPLDPLLGRGLDRYLLVGKLGKGGMGSVYAALQRPLGHEVALKLISGVEITPVMKARFEREARAISVLDHPNIVKLYDYGFGTLDATVPYMAIEYVRHGRTLRATLERIREEQGGRVPASTLLWIFEQILNALATAHDQGIVHRDMKPDNVMITSVHGNPFLVKVLDFGLAKAIEDVTGFEKDLTHGGQFLGTPLYMAPEQIPSSRQPVTVDHRADLYAVAAMLFEVLTGVPPFFAATPLAVLVKKTDPNYRVMDEPEAGRLPADLKAVLEMGLHPDPGSRFQTAEALATALRQTLTGPDVVASSIRVPPGPDSGKAATPASVSVPEPDVESTGSGRVVTIPPKAGPPIPGEKAVTPPASAATDLREILAGVVPRRWIPRGMLLFRQGDPGDAMVVVVDGALRVELEAESGQRILVGELGPGDVVGEMTCLDPAPRSATVTAQTDVQILAVDRGTLASLRERMPAVFVGILRAVITQVTVRIRETDLHVERLGRLLDLSWTDSVQDGKTRLCQDSNPVARFPAQDIELLARVAQRRQLGPGDILCREGAPGTSCFVIVSGAVEVVREIDGHETRLAVLGEGSVVGQMALIDDRPRSATLRALSPVSALELGRIRFEQVLAAQVPFALRFQERIAVSGIRQLRMADQWLASVARQLGVTPQGRQETPIPRSRPSKSSSVPLLPKDPRSREVFAFLHTALREWGMCLSELDHVKVVAAHREG